MAVTTDWDQDAFSYLLRLLSQFSAVTLDGSETAVTPSGSRQETVHKHVHSSQRPVIPKVNSIMMELIDSRYNDLFDIIHTVIYDVVMPDASTSFITWGRFDVLREAMSFLLLWGYSDVRVLESLHTSSQPAFHQWLKRLTLEAPESQLRQEACKCLHRLCLGKPHIGPSYAVFALTTLLDLLPDAVNMEPLMNDVNEHPDCRKGKVGACCQDYLWLTSQILDNLDSDSLKQFDLNELTERLRGYIGERQFYEQRHMSTEDEGLVGLLTLLTVVMKRNEGYKHTQAAKGLLGEVFDDLFLLPSINKKHLPKCKSNSSRCAAYDLLVELVRSSADNYRILHSKLVRQHDTAAGYPWDYWPMEDVRSTSGFVGLQNLGATCYMATCMQHIFMIPEARQKLLSSSVEQVHPAYTETLKEIQKMFAYLMESERKSYNPQDFCRVYEMDRQPLNTGEQKDMTEFFTDFISKLEDMSPDLKALVKELFGGVLSNNVMSMECPHFSTRPEDFYSIRCQVADMKTLYESLDEVCVKDTLDGDNMYNCSQCSKKVRAEKRACFKHLPKMLCFNTMRYTFNMVTMLKEKINTHFSFPHRLDMAPYMESNLLKKDKLRSGQGEGTSETTEEVTETENTHYELIGITVHTGTADGGHYYSFIKDKVSSEASKRDTWFLFNDSEVKAFDSSQLAQECFGGEMTSTTYDTIADKFMDFSFERTNSAYMLFYERVDEDKHEETSKSERDVSDSGEAALKQKYKFEMSEELANWIWKDNTAFLRDKNIFCHNYFGFMWQMCAYIPTTLPKPDTSVRVLPAQLSTMFLLETFIHAKEKPTMVQWIELLTKQFNQCHDACEWLLDRMSVDDHWSKQILINCSNQMIRQMFQRLLIHVITQLRNRHFAGDKQSSPWLPTGDGAEQNVVTRFICKQLQILQQPDIQLSSCKYLAEYFAFLFEFARMGSEEKRFLRENKCISVMITFYVGEPSRPTSDDSQSGSSDEEDEAMMALVEERFKVACLEKMIHLVAMLVESSRNDRTLELSAGDRDLLSGGKGMPFIMNQIKDNLNSKQTCNLIFSLCRWNDELAVTVVELILANAVRCRSPLTCQTFLKVLTMTTEANNSPPGHPSFTEHILNNFWRVCERKPHQFLEWMSNLVCHNSIAHYFMLCNLKNWVEKYLLISPQPKVRTWAMLLLVSLVPSQAFKNFARAGQPDNFSSPDNSVRAQMSTQATTVMHSIYTYLLELMPSAKKYADISKYGVTQLVSYLTFLSLCLISKEEKLMFSPFFSHLWQMFQPKMTDPQVSINQNKQLLLLFWYHVCLDCPENVALITSNAAVTKNIAFNYILADHDDSEVVQYNRCMLPPYYGILKLCCEKSRSFTRQLAQHQNMMWAFQHILPYPSQYAVAVDELLSILQMFVTVHPDSPMEEEQAIAIFKKKVLAMYLHTLNSRADWQTLITILKVLLVTDEDRYVWVLMSGLTALSEAFAFIHGMYHEATACHVLTDISDCLYVIKSLLVVAIDKMDEQPADPQTIVMFEGTEKTVTLEGVLNSWDKTFLLKNCITLLNSYSPSEVRILCLDVLKKLMLLSPETVINQIVPQLLQQHVVFQSLESPGSQCCLEGPYYPTRASSRTAHPANITVRPPQPQFGMLLRQTMVAPHKGQDTTYLSALNEFYMPYHLFVDFMVRVAVNKSCLSEDLVNLSALVAYEGIPLNSPYFAKLWCEIYQAQKTDKDFVQRLCASSHMIDYMESILHDNRHCLNNQHIHQFFNIYFTLVHHLVLCEEGNPDSTETSMITEISQSLHHVVQQGNTSSSNVHLHSVIHKAQADLRAMLLIYRHAAPTEYDAYVAGSLSKLKALCVEYKKRMNKQINELSEVQKVVSAVEDNQKVPEVSGSGDDQQVPEVKKRRLSASLQDEECVKEQAAKVTIDYRPGGSATSKGQVRPGARKGKAPAKRSQQPRLTVKSSQPFTASDGKDEHDVAESGRRKSTSISSDSSDSGAVGSTSTAHQPDSSGSSEAIGRTRKKMELADNVLDTIGAILSLIEFLETDDD